MPTRVLWVTKGLGPGGAERLLCAAARAHDSDRFAIECAYVLPYKDHLAEELEQAGVRTHCLSKRRRDPLWPLRLTQLVRNGDWDVVHVHSPLPGSIARLSARTMRDARRPLLVATEHNRWATHRRPTYLLNRWTSRWNDATFAVTAEVGESVRGPAATQVEVLRHGIDVAQASGLRTERNAARAELGLDADEFVIGTVANYRPQKDYPNLLDAMRLLTDRDVGVRLVAVGQGPDEAEVQRRRAELGLDERFVLTGFRDDAVRVMAACDAFVIASQWEGLPVALMEAHALGLPVVATAVGGLAEELVDGDTALLVPRRNPQALAKAIERVATEEGLRDALAAASANRAATYDVASAIPRIEEIYVRAGDSAAVDEQPVRRSRSAPTGVDIRPATPGDRDRIVELCRQSLGWGDDPRFERLFAWKHDENAFGPSYMWVAADGDRIVGLRAFMRWEFERGEATLRAVRAVDTATHPDYQGRGLFTAMTMHGLDEVRGDGVDFVFNTPNAQSRPGYVKMGWTVVGRLPVALRFAGPSGPLLALRSRTAASHWPVELPSADGDVPWGELASLAGAPDRSDVRSLRTRRSEEFLQWRYGIDMLGYRAIVEDDAAVVVRVRARGASRELVLLDELGADGDRRAAMVKREMRRCRADHALRIGRLRVGKGEVPAAGLGPILTHRAVNATAEPPLSNWMLSMGDVELF
ncbi:MAG: GNAT family N-acetyltransferase [Actinomycetota bacterium]